MTAPATNFTDPTGVTLLADSMPGSPYAVSFPMCSSMSSPRHNVLIVEMSDLKVKLASVIPTVPFRTPNLPLVRVSLNSFPPQYKALDYTPVEFGQIFPPPVSEKTI